MKRRSFLQLLTLPILGFWPRTAQAQASGPAWSDDLGTPDLSALYDNDLTTGITYG